jgi:response regulator of citrate/malate metabolism
LAPRPLNEKLAQICEKYPQQNQTTQPFKELNQNFIDRIFSMQQINAQHLAQKV